MAKILAVSLGLVVTWEAGIHVADWFARKELFTEAQAHARAVGKPLLVVGNPTGSVTGISLHGCGDVCLDISGCPTCPTSVIGDVRDLSMFRDGRFGASFVSHVLEHLSLDDARKAFGELSRVSDAVFIACPTPLSLWNRFFPGHIWQCTEENLRFVTGLEVDRSR